jgi:hypothetical protein
VDALGHGVVTFSSVEDLPAGHPVTGALPAGGVPSAGGALPAGGTGSGTLPA